MTRVLLHRRAKFLCILTIVLLLTASWTQFGFAGANLDQGSNGTAAAPISPIDWINGNAGASKAHLIEGYSQAYRLDVTGLSAGQTYKVRLAYDIKQGGKHAFDYLTHFACLQPHNVLNVPFDHPAETIDPTKGLGAVGVEFDPPADLSIPAPSSAGSPVPNQPTLSFNDMFVCEKKITIYNGIINSITYVSQGNLPSTGNSTAEIEIMFTVAAGRNRVLFAWGAHIASAIDWLGNSASEISGSPYHMHFNGLFDFNGNPISGNSSQDRSLSADAVINPCEVLNVQCEGQNLCGASTCNPLTAQCVNTYAPAGTQCGDPNTTGICQIGGVCTGDSLFCPAAVDAPDGTPCTDSNACTQNDTCQSGACVPGTPVVCTALDQCHIIGVCDPANGFCSDPAKANGSTCNDGNACTQTDTCQEGVCTGNNPVVCTASDQCHDAGVCNPNTGICSNPTKTNGSTCNDGNACTSTDTCQAGVCTGGTPVICIASDQCHDAGICNPSTGLCSNPSKPNNTPCTDGNACTVGDSCQQGACLPGSPVVCTARDQCHIAGTCHPTTGICSNPPAPAGTTCGSQDDTACNAPDRCDGSGTCVNYIKAQGVLCRHVDDACNPDETCNGESQYCPGDVVFQAGNGCEPSELGICRTAGFWATHGGREKPKSINITQQVIDFALQNSGPLYVCGEYITNTTKDDAASALEAMCVPVKGDQQLQLARQLTAAALNCTVSGYFDCVGYPKYENAFATCNTTCETNPTGSLDYCIAKLDCLNNGGTYLEPGTVYEENGQEKTVPIGGFCRTGTCSNATTTPCNGGDLGLCPIGDNISCTADVQPSCHDQSLCLSYDGEPILGPDGKPLLCFNETGPAGSTNLCNDANKTACTVVGSGEVLCKTDSRCSVYDAYGKCLQR